MMLNATFGLLSVFPAMQEFLQALDRAKCDDDLARFMTIHAVLFTDLSGFSAHPLLIHAMQRVLQTERMLHQALLVCQGRLVKSLGDSHLALFDAVDHAVSCVEIMQQSMSGNPFCAGIGYGEMIVCQHESGRIDAFSREVSTASRLGEDIAHGSQVLLSQAAYEQLSPISHQRCIAGQQGSLAYWELLATS